MKDGKAHLRRSAIDILEEAVHVLKMHPSSLEPYYFGTLPFVLGLLYFWTDMSTGANAWRHCAQGAWGLTVLFLWMKTWQSVYARGLLARIRNERPGAWSPRRVLRAAAFQAAIQPWGVLVLPVALVIMLPFPQVFAFFQNATLMGSGDERDMAKVIKESWTRACLWPGQNMLLIWLASPFLVNLAALVLFAFLPVLRSAAFQARDLPLSLAEGFALVPLCPLGMVVALNAGLCLFLVPWLLRSLFGLETIFSMGGAIAFNDTSLAIICGLVYLCLDPVLKAAYCLRCFHGEAVHTGADLLVALRELKRPGLGIALLLALFLGSVCPLPAFSQSPSLALSRSGSLVPAKELDGAIGRVMDRPLYTWRMAREHPPSSPGGHGMVHAFLASVIEALRVAWQYVEKGLVKLWEWVRDLIEKIMPQADQERSDSRWTAFSKPLIIGPLLGLMALVAFLGWRVWRRRKMLAMPVEKTGQVLLDLTRADVDARALPEDGWLAMAREMRERGELRLALRALYLATLAYLAREDLISLAPHKSDREYERELRLRSHVRPQVPFFFAENRVVFERTWYGLNEVTPGVMERFLRNQESMRNDGQE